MIPTSSLHFWRKSELSNSVASVARRTHFGGRKKESFRKNAPRQRDVGSIVFEDVRAMRPEEPYNIGDPFCGSTVSSSVIVLGVT